MLEITRGPWITGGDPPQSIYWGVIAILESSPEKRTLVWQNHVHVTEHKANARLIAKAPEMLETLKHTRWFLMTKARKDPEERRIVAALEAVIAEAQDA